MKGRSVDMIGLIIKDFILLKKSMVLFAIISVLYFFLGISMDNPYFITGIISVCLTITTVSLFAYDDMAKWEAFALTMPLTRSKLIQARYLMMFILTLIGAVFSSILTIAVNIYLKVDSLFEGFQGIGYGAAIILLMMSVIIPLVIKLGVERARLLFVALFIVPTIVITMIQKMLEKGNTEIPAWLIDAARYLIENFVLIAPLVVLLIVMISYTISTSIYEKKEI